jgi:hypothetical protein
VFFGRAAKSRSRLVDRSGFGKAAIVLSFDRNQVNKQEGTRHKAYGDKQMRRLCVGDTRDRCGQHGPLLTNTLLRSNCAAIVMAAAKPRYSETRKAALIFSVEMCSIIRPGSQRGDDQQARLTRKTLPTNPLETRPALSSKSVRLVSAGAPSCRASYSASLCPGVGTGATPRSAVRGFTWRERDEVTKSRHHNRRHDGGRGHKRHHQRESQTEYSKTAGSAEATGGMRSMQ